MNINTYFRPVLPISFALFLIVSVFMLTHHSAGAVGQIKYVDKTAAGDGDGSSWEHAYTDLQLALSSATAGDEIWVASGVYTPGVSISDTFHLVDGVALYGGFVGSEENRAERDWHTHITVLSGDLEGNDPADSNGIITSTKMITGQNSLHVVTGSEVQATSILDGFVVTGGYAQGQYPWSTGGGMYIMLGRPTVSNVTFQGNYASQWAGAMYNNKESHTTLTNLVFIGNEAGQSGGAMFNLFSNVTMVNLVFNGNSARKGGGLYNYASHPTLTNVTFSGNSADVSGGGIFNNFRSFPTIVNTILWNNKDSSGIRSLAGNLTNEADPPPVFSHSLVQGSGGSGNWDPSAGRDGGFNIDSDPLFVRPAVFDLNMTQPGDLQLQLGSPAINVGNSISYSQASRVMTDAAGQARIDSNLIDLGAFEFQTVADQSSSLMLTFSGLGKGSVTSSPAGVDCSADCSREFDADTVLTLTANADNGSAFDGWSGDCTGTGACVVRIAGQKSVIAKFADVTPPIFPLAPLKQPADGVTVTQGLVSFNWDGAFDAESAVDTYNLIVTRTLSARDSELVAYTFTTTETTYTPTVDFPAGDYEWTVIAYDSGGNKTAAGTTFAFSRRSGGIETTTFVFLPILIRD